MADIQSSLQRLQESIRGLSDASALVGALGVDVDVNQDIFQEDQAGVGTSVSPPQQPAVSSPTKYHRLPHDGGVSVIGGVATEPDGRSSLGSSGGPSSHDEEQQSMLSSIPRELRDSAEMRAARELEDLRLEKESLQVMKQQLAAVHKLRIDLQRKDSVIQSLQLKVQEGQAARDREGRLEAHCHLLEKRCSYLESTNGEYAERFGALDQESRARVDDLMRGTDELKRQLRDTESELKAQERRYEGTVSAHRRELGAALAEADDARGLANELRDSLQEASAQAKRRQGRWSDMEKLLTSQLEDTRASLKRAERRATATADVRRRDAEAAAAAAAALSAHLEASATATGAACVEGVGDGVGDGGGDAEAAKQQQHDSTATFVDLSGRWCGNEILALTWIEVSKALEALDAARLGHRTAVLSLRDSRRQVGKQQEEIADAKQALKDLRQELSRLQGVEARLGSTAAQLQAARERERRRDSQRDGEWALLSNIGAIAGARRGHENADRSFAGGRFVGGGGGRGGVHGGSSPGGVEVEEGPSTTATDDAKGEEILAGIRLLISEWSDRGDGLETLTRRLREEGERRDDERGRLEKLIRDAEGEAGARGEELARMMVEFETRAACAEADMEDKVAKAKANAEAEANLRVSTAVQEAHRSVTKAAAEADGKVAAATSSADEKVAHATASADRRVAEATASADQKVAEVEEDARRRVASAVQHAHNKTEATDRRVAEAQEALALAKSEEAAALALSEAAVEGQRGAEAALRVLGRFVGPLHRLCLELREQKRFLARSYRRDKPLQAELFAVAAAVSGKDYWCLLSDSTSSDSGPSDAHASNAARPRHRGGSITTGNNRGGGDGDEVLQRQWEGQDAAPDAVPVRVPPSLRAVVIAVLFANRLAASAREASAARATFAADGGRGGGGGREAVAEARLERHEMRRHRQRQQVGGGGQTDSRYLSRAGGLPVLPPGCCGAKGRPLRMPAESELETMPDDKALETVLTRLLVFGGCCGDSGENERGGGGPCGGRGGGDGGVHGGGVMSSGGLDGGGDREGAVNALNIRALWGGGGARVGDLLYHLLRGRKDHMTRVKERGLALDPRPPRLWSRDMGGAMLSSPDLPRSFSNDLDCAWGGGRVCRGAAGGGSGAGLKGWRVKLGRAVRLELERSVWLGEGPGQPGSLHLRDIRKALAALARELNDSEAKRLQIEDALRSAGGGVGISELEESADVLRRRVELLEAEVAAKPVVDVDAFAALEEDLKTATAVAEGLRVQVDRLEAELATARGEVSEAAAVSRRACAHREEAEERVRRLNDSKLELVREVEQLKAFSIRANLEREECLERERAQARERVDETLNSSPVRGACRESRATNPAFFANQTRGVTRRAAAEEDVIASNNENDMADESSPLPSWQWRWEGGPLEDSVEWSRQPQTQRAQQQQEHDQTQQRLAHSQEELRRRRNDEERSRARCLQLEARLAEARDRLEEQKGVTASMRRAAARAHGDAEAARKEVRDTEARMSRQESECRRQISLLEARLLETGVKNSRRRDLLQLQACAQEDLVKALTEEAPPTPSTCGETRVGGASDDGLPEEEHEGERAFASCPHARTPLRVASRADGTR